MQNRKRQAEAHHGGLDWGLLQVRGIDPSEVIDLSSNLLSVDQPKSVRDAILDAAVAPYPDRDCHALRAALAKRVNVDANRILAGNGCCELIHLVAGAFLSPQQNHPSRCLVVGPTFSEYERASLLCGAVVDRVEAVAEDGFAVPIQPIQEMLHRRSHQVIWICNPNNPTGSTTSPGLVRRWLDSYPETLFVVDESYLDFCQGLDSLVADDRDNLVTLRSMTKSYALAGLRLGYLTTSESRLQTLKARRVPWSVNSVVQSVAVAALESQSHYDDAMKRMIVQRTRLINEFTDRGFNPLPTETGFFLLPVEDSAALVERLLQSGVLVRDCESFGLENYVRIAVGDTNANDRLLAALDAPSNQSVAIGREPELTQDVDPVNPVGISSWSDAFREQLYELFRMRRDVRQFSSQAIEHADLARWIDAACLAPSVGLSEPWRFVSVNDPAVRQRVAAEFEAQNQLAAEVYEDSARDQYQQLKLAGLRQAPEHLAVFVQSDPQQGRGLGRQTMPETVAYSVVAAIQNFWLAARCDGVGVGWVSILRPQQIGQLLQVPSDWQLIAYLCVGYPQDANESVPELERRGWQQRSQDNQHWIER
ncbi:5,6-dimethylbenzimidazole synthase [Stieleria sp. TO1_6]|uniref:5,6-dimethylbenzimidazole synthase n=1 Tax=Stieleria tagensis TaxID=2956795 RepID=UPI00209B540A|nr:5,6-dimethylbenzimidazole synthase [Stieleria tagensis]MCO8121060.1 5,6-dimethylbenzimidazole synthase [Stieleria tagensis]